MKQVETAKMVCSFVTRDLSREEKQMVFDYVLDIDGDIFTDSLTAAPWMKKKILS